MMLRLTSALIVTFAFFQTSFANADEHELVTKIVEYFPGQWEIKSEEIPEGNVDWSTVSGGTSIAGPGMSEGMATYHLAGWDPSKKIWVHSMHRKDGQYLRLELCRHEGDTYYGTSKLVEADGSVSKFTCENKIVDENHFVITSRGEGTVKTAHWHRKK